MDISRFAKTTQIDPITKTKLLTTLDNYRQTLALCWNSQGGAPHDELRLASIERELDALLNDARLRTTAP